MKNYRVNILLAVSLGFYFLLWQILNPVLGYMLDSDCVAYLTIAERVAKGDYFKSINGLWSPLNGWLLVPFIKAGFNSWDVAKAMNCLIGGIILVQSFFLANRFLKNKTTSYLFAFAFPIILVYQVYFQMFGDVLQLVFLLSYISLFISKDFFTSKWKIILAGVFMGIGYYAKAYSLFFFLIHFILINGWVVYQQKITVSQSIKNIIIGFVSIFIIIFPWNYLLHKKYNEWNFIGQSGKMNMSWNINSGKSFKPEYTLIIPPTYQNSPSFWEDPYPTQQNLSSPISSSQHFIKWIARVVHTCFEAITCFNELTFFAFAILGLGLIKLLKKNNNIQNKLNLEILFITILIIPFGYLLMHIETRYIWANGILLWVFAYLILDDFITISNRTKLLLQSLIAFSFIYFPLRSTFELRQKNKDLFETAHQLNQQNWQGKFTSNVTDAGRMWVIAYLTKSQFYTIERTDYKEDELISEMKRYGVKYYFYEAENNKIKHSLDENYFKKINQIGNLEIYEKLNNE